MTYLNKLLVTTYFINQSHICLPRICNVQNRFTVLYRINIEYNTNKQ